MLLRHVYRMGELVDQPLASGQMVSSYLLKRFPDAIIEVTPITEGENSTDFISITVPGSAGKTAGGTAPTLGILGRLGGLGARPEVIGLVSDADGAVAALACAMKLLDMRKKGDVLEGDVVIKTHICPDAPTQPHDPVPFMGSPVDMATVNAHEVTGDLDAILSCDTTKGNRIANWRGFAISPTVMEGYILKVSSDLLDIMEITTGQLPRVLPITQQDITPYGNGLDHINSIMQPATATDKPVVGVALVTETAVPGSASGASHAVDIEEAARFMLEVAKAFTAGKCEFHDAEEFALMKRLYGSNTHFQTKGEQA